MTTVLRKKLSGIIFLALVLAISYGIYQWKPWKFDVGGRWATRNGYPSAVLLLYSGRDSEIHGLGGWQTDLGRPFEEIEVSGSSGDSFVALKLVSAGKPTALVLLCSRDGNSVLRCERAGEGNNRDSITMFR